MFSFGTGSTNEKQIDDFIWNGLKWDNCSLQILFHAQIRLIVTELFEIRLMKKFLLNSIKISFEIIHNSTLLFTEYTTNKKVDRNFIPQSGKFDKKLLKEGLTRWVWEWTRRLCSTYSSRYLKYHQLFSFVNLYIGYIYYIGYIIISLNISLLARLISFYL